MLIKVLPLFTEALKEVAEIAAQLQSSLIRLENFQKLTELQRDLIGIENLTAPGRVSPLSTGQGTGLEKLWEVRPRWNLTSISVLFSGVHTRGLSVQAHQEGAAAEDVLPGS